MNSLQLLEAIGEVNGKYILEAQACRERKPQPRASKLKVLLIAAAVSVLLTGCTYAVVKLHDLKVGQWQPKPFEMNEEEKRNPPAPRDVLSLQGFAGTPEFLANKEWREFESGYDLDGALLHEEDRARNVSPEAYDSVFAYTKELETKVDEICEKYNLKLPGRCIINNAPLGGPEEHLFPVLGIPGIHRSDAAITATYDGNGYYYQNGSFKCPGNLWLTDGTWEHEFVYSYHYVRKGYLDTTASVAVTDIDAFDQWEYTAADGTKLLLAISPDGCLVLADRADAFISINVHYPSLGETVYGTEPMTHEALEAFADAFDYNIRPLGMGQTYESYADFLTNLYPAPTHYSLYNLVDLDEDGRDELLVTRDGPLQLVLSMVDGKAKIIYFAPDCFYSTDNVIRDYSYYGEAYGGGQRYRFLKFRNGEPICVDYVEYSPIKSQWGKSVSLGDKPYFEGAISEQEAWEIIDRYAGTTIPGRPIYGFPGYQGPGAYPPSNLPPVEPSSDRERILKGTGVDPLEYVDAKIQYNGKTYVYRCPEGQWESEGAEPLGQLSYPLSEGLSTNFQKLSGWDVTRLTGGFNDDWLSVSVPNETPLFFVPEDLSFREEFVWEENEDGGMTILKYLGRQKEVVIPAEIDGKPVTRLSRAFGAVFANNPYVEHVTIPEGVTLVDDYTFYGCTNLRTVRFPASLKGIGHSAFNLCPLVEDLWFEGDAPWLGNYLFVYPALGGEPSFPRIHYHEGTTGWDEVFQVDFEHVVE